MAYVRHLRLGFELTLAPIFLWGALLSGGRWDWGTTAAFVALHLFLYPAATAFNAAFDRDVGPVAGMERPPRVPPHLAAFAIVLALIGAAVAAFAGPAFLGVYAAIVVWTAAYSHPLTRWKASPWKSALAIALGQGALGFAAGWIATDGPTGGTGLLALGAAACALTALGLYPATQVFQMEEDNARGDRTLAVALGPRRALRFGTICLAAGGALTVWLVLGEFGRPDAVLIALGYAALILINERLARAPDYRRAMRVLNVATFAFLLFILLQAIGGEA